LEKDPAKRYPSALALAEDLERWQRHEPIHARATGILSRGWKWVRRNPAKAVLIPSLAAVVVLALNTFWNREPELPANGIAVLPFENLSGDNSFLADGIQDDILTKLAKIAELHVISRTSVMQYRGERNIRKIGNALRVSHLLEGSVRREGQQLHLNAQLIDTRNDRHVWAENYDVDPANLFAIQSEIAQTIAKQLSATVSGAEKKAIETKPTQDIEAYELYVRAKQCLRGLAAPETDVTPKIKEAIEWLDRAVARDPNFALAFGSLVDAHLSLYWQVPHPPAERAAAEKALEEVRRLAPDAGETHFAQALFFYNADRDYQRALGELEIAMGLLPNNADVFHIAGRVDRRLERWSDSIRHVSRAGKLDPRDWRNPSQLFNTYFLLRMFREADDVADRGIAAFPESAAPFWIDKGQSALAQGDTIRAREYLQKAGERSNVYLLYRISMCERNFTEAKRAAALLAEDKSQSEIYPPIFWETVIAHFEGDEKKARQLYVVARETCERLLREGGDYPEAWAALALLDVIFARGDDAVREAQRAIDLMPISKDPLNGSGFVADLALVYGMMGERDRAFEQLRAYVKMPPQFDHTLGELKLSPLWDCLRNDPRFAEILAEAAKPLPIQ
jgi:TolB-like protein